MVIYFQNNYPILIWQKLSYSFHAITHMINHIINQSHIHMDNHDDITKN